MKPTAALGCLAPSLAFALALGASPAALAGDTALFEAGIKVTCTGDFDNKLISSKLTNDDVIANIVGAQDAPLYALVMQHPLNQLELVLRCNGSPVKSLSTIETAHVTGSEVPLDAKAVYMFGIRLWNGSDPTDGLLNCSVSTRQPTGKPVTKKGKCSGVANFGEKVCSVSLAFGRPFKPSGPCPPS